MRNAVSWSVVFLAKNVLTVYGWKPILPRSIPVEVGPDRIVNVPFGARIKDHQNVAKKISSKKTVAKAKAVKSSPAKASKKPAAKVSAKPVVKTTAKPAAKASLKVSTKALIKSAPKASAKVLAMRDDAPKRLKKSPLTKSELEEFRKMLVAKRRDLLGDMSGIESGTLRTNRQDGSGDLSNMPTHPADIGSDNFEHEFTLGLLESERALLQEINEALERIENGTFGICMGTGQAIGVARLRARPWAKYCIEYARLMEKGLVRPGEREEDNRDNEDGEDEIEDVEEEGEDAEEREVSEDREVEEDIEE